MLVFFVVVPCLPSRCLAMKGGIYLVRLLPSNNSIHTYADTRTDMRDRWKEASKKAKVP
jgi:hypothetical protein